MIAIKTYKKQERVDYKSLIVVNKATQNYDPTRTTVLRSRFIKDMDRRFVSLCRLIKQAIIEDDVFGLIEPKHELIKIITVNETPGKEAFKFSTSQDKVSQFMTWLKEQERKGLLNTTTIPQIGTPIEKAWTDQYITDSYKRGVTRARYEMGAAGMGTPGIEETGGISASMSTPFHMDRVGMLYARTFEDLKGITAAMDANISRILSQGMVDGDGPRALAKKIVDATGISRNRAMTLARTEIIRAHHSAMVQEYKNWAVEGVVVKAEWVDAGFNVCPKCAENNGKIFTLDEIEGLIPAHPNCRCIALPTMPKNKNAEGIQQSRVQKEETALKKYTVKDLDVLKNTLKTDNFIDNILITGENTSLISKVELIKNTLEKDIYAKYPNFKKKRDAFSKTATTKADEIWRIHKQVKSLTIVDDTIIGAGNIGEYDTIKGTIKIVGKLNDAPVLHVGEGNFLVADDTASVFRHEYGHYILDNKLVDREHLVEWQKVWGIEKANISEYATVNYKEGFSESFSAFTSPLYKTGDLPKAIEEIMKQILN